MNTDRNIARFTDVSLRTAALVAGLGLLIMAILGPIVELNILQALVMPGDAKATAENITASIGPFRMGITMFLLVAVLDVLVAWALYLVLKPVNGSLSLLSARRRHPIDPLQNAGRIRWLNSHSRFGYQVGVHADVGDHLILQSSIVVA
jgi:hypothetical protein